MLFGTINNIDKPLTQNDWCEGDTITNMKYETSDIITDTTDNKKKLLKIIPINSTIYGMRKVS